MLGISVLFLCFFFITLYWHISAFKNATKRTWNKHNFWKIIRKLTCYWFAYVPFIFVMFTQTTATYIVTFFSCVFFVYHLFLFVVSVHYMKILLIALVSTQRNICIVFVYIMFFCCFLLIHIWLHREKNTFSRMILLSKIHCVVYETTIAKTLIVNFCILCTHLTHITITLILLFRMNTYSLYFKVETNCTSTHTLSFTSPSTFLND